MQQRKLEVCLSPALLHLHDIRESIVVVIDIFRATSSMCYGLANGAEAVFKFGYIGGNGWALHAFNGSYAKHRAH